MYVKNLDLLRETRYLNLDEKDCKEKLMRWCTKAWERVIRGVLTLKREIIQFDCCNTYVRHEDCTASGHPLSMGTPISALFVELKITSAETLFAEILRQAEVAKKNGKKVPFPSINKAHNGLPIASQVMMQKREIVWFKARVQQVEADNAKLREQLKKLREQVRQAEESSAVWCQLNIRLAQQWMESQKEVAA